jgi:putative tryptophan/tyrosine transport system substrate-binding protein
MARQIVTKVIRRRNFIALLGAAAMAPLRAKAQARATPVIGFLNTTSPGPIATLLAAFHHGLDKAGFVEGRNLLVEYRWAEGRYDQLPAMAADLVRRRVAVIAATGGLISAQAAKGATSTIPVLFVAGFDPVQEGLVASINRPGGNATGVSVYTAELGRKRLELLRQLVPGLTKIAMLVNPHSISTEIETNDLGEAARALGVELHVVTAATGDGIENAFGEAANRGAGALIVSADSFFTSRRDQLVALAARHALPASYPWSQYAEAGGLFSYGTNLTWAYEQIGTYVARILKGTKPADLPVQMPTTFDMVINLKTAQSLGISIPPFLLATANRVIE